MKANSNQAVIATLAKLGAGADVVSGGELKRARAAGIPADKIMFSGIGKTARRACARGRRRHSLHQRRVRAGARTVVVDRVVEGARRADLGARQSRHRSQDAPQDRHRQGREQVRHPDQPRARGLCARRQAARASRSPASTCTSAARSPSSSRSATPSRCWRNSCATLRADGHTISHVDLGGGLGIPYRDDNEPPPHPEAYADAGQARDARSRIAG